MTEAKLRIVTIADPNTAFGVAARLSLAHPPFARLPFGQWAAVLDGQAQRGHQAFVLNDTNRAVGFFGYALATEEIAEDWISGKKMPTHEELTTGDCLIWNAWIAEDKIILRFMWQAFRRLARDKRKIFFKRYYADGRVRPGKVSVTEAVEGHIRRYSTMNAA